MRVFILAGEPSGDKLGGALMAGLRTLCPEVRFDGVGGVQMQAQGLESRFPMSELSVMGIAEVLPKYRALKARLDEMAQAVISTRPDLLITIDAPDFSFRLARMVKAASTVRTVHYVAPTVWAWRPRRAEKIAGFIDHLLALFPFEPPYFERYGLACDFVGHPVVAEPRVEPAQAEAFRSAQGIGRAPLLVALPGSREAEVRRLAGVFGDAIARVAARCPDLRIVVPAAEPVAAAVRDSVRDWPCAPIVLDPRGRAVEEVAAEKRAAFAAGDFALAASGTVSLELAAARTPMVIAYRMHWLTFRLIRWMALIDTVTLVNLVAESRTVPEFLGPACLPDPIAAALLDVLGRPGDQIDAMNLTMQRLGEGEEAPGLRAARAVLSRLET